MTAPRIDSIRARTVVVPLPEPHRTASGVIEASPLVLIDIGCNKGVTGHAIIFTYTDAALKPCAELIRNLAPLVIDQELAPKAITAMLAQKFRLLGTQGLMGMAIAGIDMALWDLLSRCQDLPLHGLLGGNTMPVTPYAAVGFDGEKGSAVAAENHAAQGFRGIKAKIGYPTADQDLAVVNAMRAAVGPDVEIMVDYNQSLNPVEAVKRIRMLDEAHLGWVEEPVLAHDYASHAEIRGAVETPIQCGENWWGIQDMQHAVTAGASTLVMPDIMKIGGVSGWLQAAVLAECHRLPMSNHLWPEVSARLLCVTPTAHWLEYADWWNAVLQEPLEIHNGVAVVDDRPGSGLQWNEKNIQNYVV